MKNVLYLVVIALLSLGTGCSRVVTVSPTISSTAVFDENITQTPAFTITITELTPLVTATQIVQTPTISTPTPTWEIAATDPIPKEILDRVFWLFKDNAGCRLPCWWGIEPGKTTLQEAVDFLEPIMWGWDEHTNFVDRDGIKYYIFFFHLPVEDEWDVQTSFLLSVREEDNVIESISSSMDAHHIDLHLIPEILSEYGKPESIVLSGSAAGGYGGGYFVNIYMYYPQYGFLSSHTFRVENEEREAGSVEVCSSLQTYSGLMLWNPENDVSIEVLSEMWPGYWYGDFIPLEQVSNLAIDEFYNIFTGLPKQCIEIRTDSWFSMGN